MKQHKGDPMGWVDKLCCFTCFTTLGAAPMDSLCHMQSGHAHLLLCCTKKPCLHLAVMLRSVM